MASVADQLRAEGERKGRREGHAEGHAEGRREVLLRLLGLRFGELSKEVRERVNAAEPASASSDAMVAWASGFLAKWIADENSE